MLGGMGGISETDIYVYYHDLAGDLLGFFTQDLSASLKTAA